MRRAALLLVLCSSACVGSYPVRIRPGSNVALPAEGSLVGSIVNGYLCEKSKKRADGAGGRGGQCSLTRGDTLPVRVDTLPPIPPAKRP